MRTSFKAALAALSVAALAAGLAMPAQAQYRYDSGDRDRAAITAGIAGLAIGAAIGSSSRRDHGYAHVYPAPHPRYSRGYAYAAPRAYGPPRGYGYQNRAYGYYAPRTCVVRQRVFDRYSGRWVRVQQRVPC